MQYVFVDDSVSYDGYSPIRRPLGGAEKAVVSLATALLDRGADVTVVNNTTYAHMAFGVNYVPIGGVGIPRTADVVIAVRKPLLLGSVRGAKQRVLWVTGSTDYLSAAANAPLWDSFQPTFMFTNPLQQRAYTGKVPSVLLTPGTSAAFLPPILSESTQPAVPQSFYPHTDGPPPELETPVVPPEPAAPTFPPAHAIVTTHPLHGLGWLLDVWTTQIQPQLPDARLLVISAVLNKGIKGESVPDDIVPILEKVIAAASANVVVAEPRGDEGMATNYREARVHLYPGNPLDYACWTLRESQSLGVPAVARALGGVNACIDNGQTGYVVPDEAAFANVTLEILRNDAVYQNLSKAASDVGRERTWDVVAEEFEAIVLKLPGIAR